MRRKILSGVAAALAALAILIATRPSAFRVERSTHVAAPARAVYARLGDLHRWSEWSPWAHVDPVMKQSFQGAPSGTGAAYSWSSSSRIGAGTMYVVEARADELVAIRMDLTWPLRSTSWTELRLLPDAGGAEVTWVMHGRRDFLGKAAALFGRLDSMLGADFENGLDALRRVTEAEVAQGGVSRR